MQAGFNYELGSNMVIGVEVNGDLASLTGSGAAQVIGGGTGTYNWLAKGPVKLGFAPADNFLVYADGGLAMAGFHFDGSAGCTFNETRTGAALGLGASFKMTRNVSIDGNYNHVWFPSQTSNCAALGGIDPVTNTSRSSADVLKVGLNYHF